MKKKEAPRSVPAIQFLDPSGHDVDIFCVLRHALSRRVSKIGQERKVQIRIRISEVTNFEAIELVLDCVRGGQQQRHHNQGAAIIGNTFFFEGHFGQDLRRQERGHEIIHGQHRQLARGQEQQKSQQPVCQPMNRSGAEKKRRYDHRGRKQENASEVRARPVRTKPSAQPFRERNLGARRPLERRSARVDQIIADVSCDLILRGLRQRQRLVDRFLFRTP